MNILFLDKFDASKMTGSTVHKYQLLKNLSELNQTCHIPVKSDDKLPNINVDFFKVKGGAIRQTLTFCRQVSKHKVDIAYTRNHQAGILGIWLKKRYGIKLVYEVNGILEEELKLWNIPKMTRKAKKRIKEDLRVAEAADAVITVSQEIAHYYLNRGIKNEKIFIIENGVDTSVFKPLENARQNILNKYNFTEDVKIVLFVGLFFKWQGIDILIKSFKQVYEKNANARLLLVGEGIELANLELRAKETGLKDKIIFTGRIDHSQIPEYISAADVCVSLLHPSKSGSLKVWEYLACGRTVVATRMPAYMFIEENTCGILVEHNNIDDTANAINHLIQNTDTTISMGNNGRQYVVETHTWNKTAKKTFDVFNKLFEEP